MNYLERKSAQKLINGKAAAKFLKVVKVWSGPTRFKILLLLSVYKRGFTVTELANILHSSLSRISHQLRILKKYQLVSSTGQNRETVYKITNSLTRKHLSSYLTRL
ncbi:MAG: winged helix-turn-helix transcriptional regulator [Candidatus Harrisonbacteria bacterium]|nr:winged helix-turn-helix transcriptional regulator [Candidatus Harrisonbacteria bacterium]